MQLAATAPLSISKVMPRCTPWNRIETSLMKPARLTLTAALNPGFSISSSIRGQRHRASSAGQKLCAPPQSIRLTRRAAPVPRFCEAKAAVKLEKIK